MPISNIMPESHFRKPTDPQITGAEEAVILEIDKQKKKITKGDITKNIKGLVKYAVEIGLTNDKEAFENDMATTILNGFKKAAKNA